MLPITRIVPSPTKWVEKQIVSIVLRYLSLKLDKGLHQVSIFKIYVPQFSVPSVQSQSWYRQSTIAQCLLALFVQGFLIVHHSCIGLFHTTPLLGHFETLSTVTCHWFTWLLSQPNSTSTQSQLELEWLHNGLDQHPTHPMKLNVVVLQLIKNQGSWFSVCNLILTQLERRPKIKWKTTSKK